MRCCGWPATGAAVLDVRSPEEFARGHLRGSVDVGLDGRFAEYAAQVTGGDIIVVCDPGRARDARLRLARVGLDSHPSVPSTSRCPPSSSTPRLPALPAA